VAARRSYRNRLESIESELRQAEKNNDAGQWEKLTAEKEEIFNELKAATGLGGRHREFASNEGKARKAVTAAIKRALKAIESHNPELAKHLYERIKSGGSCSYSSDGTLWRI